MLTKSFAAKVKATAADDANLSEGEFTALASVFNNVDAVGDVVMPGAFAADLVEWKASGEVIPLYWGHMMSDPQMCVGSILDARETDVGLEVKAQLDLDTDNGAQVYRLMKGRRVNRMSFAYDILDAAPAERDGRSVYELRQLKLHEISVVQVPANPAAVVQDVKTTTTTTTNAVGYGITVDDSGNLVLSPPAKAGRVLSGKNEESLKGALDKIAAGVSDIKSVLAALDDSKDGTASPAQPAATEEPDGAKVDAPARPGPATVRLRADLDALDAEVFSLTD